MLRAVLYARCSTEEESQKDALVKQVAEGKECIFQNDWFLADIYVESRSGTTTKGRKEYNRLFDDMLQDKFDIIVIKSQDRLMRNTKDWYLFVDRLTTQGKKLYMYIDRKFYSTDDALITGIKAILAEEYSRELSKKINNAHKGRQKNNGNVILTKNTYGLKKLPDKSVVLIPEEAAVKKKMYELCAEGYGSRTIATILKNEGIRNRKGKPFDATSILRIIRSPLNKGTVVMNKKHFDFDTKKTTVTPEEKRFVYENKVPRIVSDELWEKANREIDSRAKHKANPEERTIGVNPGKYPWSGKIICGLCGQPYYRRARRRYKDKKIVYDWKCKSYFDTGRNTGRLDRPQLRKVELEDIEGCDNVHLNEDMFNEFMEKVLVDQYDVNKNQIMQDMIKVLKKALKENELQTDIDRQVALLEKIKNQMNVLLDKLLEGIIDNSVYKLKQEQLEGEMKNIQDKINELELKKAEENNLKDRLLSIENTIKEKKLLEKATINGMLKEIHRIIVYPQYMEIEFSSSEMLGIHNDGLIEEYQKIKIEYGIHFNYREQQKDDLQKVVDYIGEHPNVIVRELAEVFGLSTGGMQQRVFKLKKQGRIRFVGKAGKGYWEVLEP